MTIEINPSVALGNIKLSGLVGETYSGGSYYYYFYNCTVSAYVDNTGCSGSLYGAEFIHYKY